MTPADPCARCGRRSHHTHHRKLRSQGGGEEFSNLLRLCNECHTWVHANPSEAYAAGFLVHSWADPADVQLYPLVDVTLERLQSESTQLTVEGGEVPHQHVVNADGVEEECPRCHGKGRVMKKSKPLVGEETGPKEKTVWAIRVPKEHREDGTEVLDGLMSGAADKLAEGGHDRGWAYRTLVMALSWFLLNYQPGEDA